ncbi:hypothetical protein ACOMHN_039976 [Nucella lapillus]
MFILLLSKELWYQTMWSFLFLAVLSALIWSPVQANSRPTFVADVIKNLQENGIFENTPVGTSVGRMVCQDADGDAITYKSRDSKYLSIGLFSGVVTVSRSIDAEQLAGEPIKVTFLCMDINSQNEEKSVSEISMEVRVRDVNDETPKFSVDQKKGFTFNISETAKNGTKLNGTIQITDIDQEGNARMKSIVISCGTPNISNPCTLFLLEIKKVSGVEGVYKLSIILNGTLDYETDSVYTPTIFAVDGDGPKAVVHNTGTVGIRIVVEDSQDTNPRFVNSVFNFAVKENLAVNTVVNFSLSARDMDGGDDLRDIYLEILDDPSGSTLFKAGVAVKDENGVFSAPVIVKSPIDRENVTLYKFTAKATEKFRNGSLTTATVVQQFTVHIDDTNDNAPQFTRSIYQTTIREVGVSESGLNIDVDDLIAFDPDLNAAFRMDIVSQSFPGAFGVTPTTATRREIFLLKVNDYRKLDYEQPQYRNQNITLRAVETKTVERRSSTAVVYVTITDVNDNKPVFVQPRYEASVSENAIRLTSILRLNATDKDTGRNGQVTYNISDTFSTVFQVDSQTGVITLIGNLDYESKRTYELVATAKDSGENPQKSEVVVVIAVTDYNEDGPRFTTQSYSGRVSETSTQFLEPVRVEALDPTDVRANITYRIAEGNTPTNSFVLNPYTGELSLREFVTYEQTPNRTGFFRLTVEASDNSKPPMTVRTIVLIQVVDENNNKPIFNPKDYTKTISEAIAPDTSLLQVFATDADFGTNGKITYRIGVGGRDSFVVTEDGKVLISGSPTLDYDQTKSLTVEILATDGGSPQFTSTATMLITITDANNKPPVFNQTSYNVIIDEALPKGSPVLKVSARDPDSNNSLQYSVLTDNIIAFNKAGAVFRSDIYDVTKVFSIDPGSGQIIVSPTGPGLDRSFMAEVTLQVMVKDVYGNAQSDTAYVFIVIIGRPETELYFVRPWTKNDPVYRLQIAESTAIGKEIKILQARDRADGTRVTEYQEVPNTDVGDYFRISNSALGKLVLNRKLDYESGKRQHSVVVRAIKGPTLNLGPRTVTATISLQVQDSNDNAPLFTKQDYTFYVKESSPMHLRVGEITAYDYDNPTFGPIEFLMGVGQDRNDFYLFQPKSSNTAEIRVNQKLSYQRRSLYTIGVIARDNANGGEGSSLRLQSKAVVKIYIQDENDNTPTFTYHKWSFSVRETAPTNTRLGQILARDSDSGDNGAVLYSLEVSPQYPNKVNPLTMVSITQVSGTLVTKRLLRGLSGQYTVMVVATDKGFPPRSSSMPVTIKVQSVEDDDGTPKWISPVLFTVSVPEHSQTKLDIKLQALSRTQNGSILYSLIPLVNGDYVNFRINRTTGDIFVIADLDREIQDTYTVLVEAKDSSNATKLSRRQLTINLIDINDNDPSFNKSRYAACPNDFEVPTKSNTPDDTPTGTIVARAVACDADSPSNSQMYYYSYTGNKQCQDNYDPALRVNLNGTVESTKVLDFEQKRQYLVCVEVRATPRTTRRKRDYNITEMKDTHRIAYLVINIIDRNDNGPRFPLKTLVGVLETVPSEEIVTQVVANDPDGPLNNRAIYAIKNIRYFPPYGKPPFSMGGAFTVNPDNGAIMTNLPSYQDFAHGYFQLEIEAFDAQNRRLKDSVNVTLVVHQRSQILRVVLNRSPAQGQQVAKDLLKALNDEGRKDGKQFFFIQASEHRTGSNIVATQTDVCFVVVDVNNKQAYGASTGLEVLDSERFKDVIKGFDMVDRGTCYPLLSTEDKVKWRDLWWVMVVIAIFIFVCSVILLITIVVLYDRYKTNMRQKTYLVPQ